MYKVTATFYDNEKPAGTYPVGDGLYTTAAHARLVAQTDAAQYINDLPDTLNARTKMFGAGIVVMVDDKPSIAYRWSEV